MLSGGLTRRVGLAAAAALLVTLAGCSGSGDAGDSAVAACNSPGVTPDQVRLGLVYSDSGAGSSALSSARSGVEARIGLANDQGGVNGRHVVYDWRDDASTPQVNARVTKELVDSGVFGLISASSALSGSLGSLAQQRIPVTGLIQAGSETYDNTFSFMYDIAPEVAAHYIHSGGGRKAAFVMSGSGDFTRQVIVKYRTAFENAGLPTSDDVISFSAGADSPSQVAQRVISAGADSVVAFTQPSDLAQIMGALRNSNRNIASVISLTGYDRSTLREFGPALANVSFSANFTPFEAGGAAIETYQRAMSRFAPETAVPQQQFAMYGYLYADLFIHGLELAGQCPTREGFITAMHNVRGYDADGLVTPVDLGNITNQPLQCQAFVRINPTGTAFDVTRTRICADGSGT